MRAAQGFCGLGHFTSFLRAEQLPHAIRQILHAIHLGRRAAFEQEIAVRGFLAGNGIQDEQRLAHRQRFGRSQAAGLGDDQVGDAHQLVHVRCETEDVRGMLAILRGQFAAQFFVATGDDDGLKRTGHLVQFRQNFRDRSHAESAA